MAFNRKDAGQVVQLRDYINAESPSGLSFATAEDPQLAVAMNSSSTATIDRASVTGTELLTAVDGAEFAALSAPKQRAWGVLMSVAAASGLDPNDASIVGQVSAVWGTSATTLGALQDLQTKEATHAESQFGDGTGLRHLDIAAARSA